MIVRLTGQVVEAREEYVVLDVSGVGYEVLVPALLATRLADSEDVVMLHTLHDVESKARSGGFTPRLIGFASPVDRSFFSDLLQVRGLGAKKAIRSLVIPISRFATAIEQGDTGLLSSLPGIGGRMAEKIVAELKGKVGHYAVLPEGEALAKRPEPERPDYQQEAISALLQLGYRGAEAAGMIDEAVKHNPDITEPDRLVRAVFKRGDGD